MKNIKIKKLTEEDIENVASGLDIKGTFAEKKNIIKKVLIGAGKVGGAAVTLAGLGFVAGFGTNAIIHRHNNR